MHEARHACPKCGVNYPTDVLFCPKDGAPLGRRPSAHDDPYLGLTLGEQFHVEKLIGIGAMGRVYRAHQEGIDRDVAIKVLHRELLRNPAVSARFLREAKVASRLCHPNVVQVLMIGELARINANVGGEAYLVMEYLDGISLASALAAAGGALSLPRALHVILQVCDAVGEAHAQGIVHRDLKPENVMLVRRGSDKDFAKVLDFGVARLDWADTVTTEAGAIFGTARYVSPEGARGETVDAASDVYSIATTLFQCLAGQTPFDGDSPVSILIKHTTEQPPSLRDIPRGSYVPDPLARAIAVNLAKDPRDRCRDAREFGRALVDAASDSGLKANELVIRSTLLGSNSRSLTVLGSVERTRTLELSPELANQLSTDAKPTADDMPAHSPSDSRPNTASAGADAQRQVGPTLVEETASDPGGVASPPMPAPAALLSAQTKDLPSGQSGAAALPPAPPELEAGQPGSSSAGNARLLGRDSVEDGQPRSTQAQQPETIAFPDADWMPPADGPGAFTRRWAIVAACFITGVGLALVIAARLGVFAAPERRASYVARAEAALAASAWDSPPGENVREITEAALRRWPADDRILRVRAEAALRLVEDAERCEEQDPERAIQLLRLATRLDPANQAAKALLAKLELPTTIEPEAPGPPGVIVPIYPRKSVAPVTGRAKPGESAAPQGSDGELEAPGTPELAPNLDPSAASPPGGRWL